MAPLGVHHVSITVSDADESVDFYTGVLGLKLRTDRPDFAFPGAWLDIGGQQVHLIEGEVPGNCGQHFAILVADLDATVDELRTSGFDVGDPRAVGDARQAFLFDPSGNMVELHEPSRTVTATGAR